MIIEKLMDTHNLTESEKQIKKFILDQNNDISAMTSIELGKRYLTFTCFLCIFTYFIEFSISSIINN